MVSIYRGLYLSRKAGKYRDHNPMVTGKEGFANIPKEEKVFPMRPRSLKNFRQGLTSSPNCVVLNLQNLTVPIYEIDRFLLFALQKGRKK